ncbi:MAG: hypothetical protein AAF623_04770 [Planctomycetota bacterium]
MQPKRKIQPAGDKDVLEVVVGVLPTSQDASRVAASLRGPDIRLQRVSRKDPTVPDELPEIVYEDIKDIESQTVTKGMLTGGAIGAGSGLLFLGMPAVGTALAIAAPFAAMLAGAWIGGIAAVDEAARGIELPNKEDYQRLLAEGKSFVVIAGDERLRKEYGLKLKELGAEEIYHHPPIQQVIRPQ